MEIIILAIEKLENELHFGKKNTQLFTVNPCY